MHRRRPAATAVLSFSLAVGAALCGPGVAAADQVAFTIDDERITESSGLVLNAERTGYWTVNDSGDSGVVYALDRRGRVTGELRYRAEPRDVEAVAMAGNRLYVADIGDNQRNRDYVTVYFFDDPRATNETVTYRAYDFAYPDGPHDAETLLVDNAGRLYLVTKGGRGAIYAAPGVPSRQAVNRLVKVGDAPAYVTDGVFLPEDDRIALRTYVSVLMLDAISYRVVARAAAPPQPQGESIALTRDRRGLLLGTEGRPSTTYQIVIPTELAKVPKAASTPPSTAPSLAPASTSPGSGEQGPAEEPSATQAGRRGTLLALGLAAVVALVAGAVVVVVRRPS